jgi:hypothetical protein
VVAILAAGVLMGAGQICTPTPASPQLSVAPVATQVRVPGSQATPASQTCTYDWTGWEQGSWVVTVIGLPIAVAGLWFGYQQLHALREDQTRIKDELLRAPVMKVGFLKGVRENYKVPEPDFTVQPQWTEGASLSDTQRIPFVFSNVGTRGARDVLVNLTITEPEDVGGLVSNPDFPRHPTDQRPTLVQKVEYIHADDYLLLEVHWNLPPGIPVILVKVDLSLAEYKGAEELLTVRIEGTS